MVESESFVFGLLGPTQFGKSSFINTLSGERLAKQGRGDGESETILPDLYEFRDSIPLYAANATLKCIDVPGFFDTKLRISDQDILAAIKILLSSRKVTQLRAMLVFQSLSESNIQLRRTIDFAGRLFGEKILKSLIVVVTKSDRCSEGSKRRLLKTVRDICRPFGVEPVVWINDNEDDPPSEEQKGIQHQALREQLQRIAPFPMEALDEFDEAINAAAERIRDKDPERWFTQQVEVTVPVGEDYIDEVPYEVDVQVPMYPTYEEQRQEALRRQATSPKDWPYQREKQVTEDVMSFETVERDVSYTYQESRYLLFFGGDTKTVTQKVQTVQPKKEQRTVTRLGVEYGTPPLEVIIDRVKGEMKTEKKTQFMKVTRTKFTDSTVMKTVKAERYDFEHYKKLGASELVNEIWVGRNALASQEAVEERNNIES